MAGERIRKRIAASPETTAPHGVRERVARTLPPGCFGPFVRLGWRSIGVRALYALGLVSQLVLLWMAGELLDLFISAVELWAELARKHLELTQ